MTSPPPSQPTPPADTRRRFFQRGIALAGGVVAGGNESVGGSEFSAAGESAAVRSRDSLRVGVLGCGRRGRLATADLLSAADELPGLRVSLVAMADAFPDRLQSAYRSLKGRHNDQVNLGDRRFTGMECWRPLLECDLDLVVLAAPTCFRPLHLEAAIAAGTNVVMERPVAMDAAGVRRVLLASQRAKRDMLSISVALPLRDDPRIQETIAEIQSGRIGDPRTAAFELPYLTQSPLRSFSKSVRNDWQRWLRDWRTEPQLAGTQLSESWIDSLDLIQSITGLLPTGCSIANQPHDSMAFRFEYSDSTFTTRSQLLGNGSPGRGHGQSIPIVEGANGYADLRRGVLTDLSRQPVWKSRVASSSQPHRLKAKTELLSKLSQGATHSNIDEAASATMTAILGSNVFRTRESMTWNDALSADACLPSLTADLA